MKTWELHLGSVPKQHTEGGEQHDHAEDVARPYVILRMFPKQGTLIACPLSTSAATTPPFRVALDPAEIERTNDDRPGYEHKHTVVMVDQIRTMAFKRFDVGGGTSRVGKLSPAQQAQVEAALNALVDLTEFKPKKKPK
ncbi:MAG: type II toxin-antitoxin system PemK/MazF family toxin [Deltaproteobacteria bacterium]|nr:type II toxin-antitoxin system PemK/MazF family toxin [Deltaproteobacteria bacterium]